MGQVSGTAALAAGQLGFYINSSACHGCKACELACKDKHDLKPGPRLRRVRLMCGGSWEKDERYGSYTPKGVFSYSVSFSCGHCDEPACVAACPTGAMTKDPQTGIVSNDREVCIGCGACAQACPYGAPQVDVEIDKVRKCDFCQDLLAQGGEPVCVGACPQRALHWGPIDELRALYGDLCDVQPLPPSELTRPNVAITPHKDAVFGTGEGRALSLDAQ